MIWFSAIHLLGMKADCVGEMSLLRRGLSLEMSSLEMILYITLHTLMGLKWLADVGLEILGMSTIREQFTSLGIKPLRKNEVIALITSSPMVD